MKTTPSLTRPPSTPSTSPSSPTAQHASPPPLAPHAALRVHRAVRRTTTRICTFTRSLDNNSSRVRLRQQTPSVHAERGWGSCPREEDFAGQNLLLPEIRFTNPSHTRNKPISPAENSRSLVSFAAR